MIDTRACHTAFACCQVPRIWFQAYISFSPCIRWRLFRMGSVSSAPARISRAAQMFIDLINGSTDLQHPPSVGDTINSVRAADSAARTLDSIQTKVDAIALPNITFAAKIWRLEHSWGFRSNSEKDCRLTRRNCKRFVQNGPTCRCETSCLPRWKPRWEQWFIFTILAHCLFLFRIPCSAPELCRPSCSEAKVTLYSSEQYSN